MPQENLIICDMRQSIRPHHTFSSKIIDLMIYVFYLLRRTMNLSIVTDWYLIRWNDDSAQLSINHHCSISKRVLKSILNNIFIECNLYCSWLPSEFRPCYVFPPLFSCVILSCSFALHVWMLIIVIFSL